MANPWNFRVGALYRQPRDGAPGYSASGASRDPLEEDVFDIELDLEYTRNSMLDAIEVRTPRRPEIAGLLPRSRHRSDVTPLSRVPENVDMPLKHEGHLGCSAWAVTTSSARARRRFGPASSTCPRRQTGSTSRRSLWAALTSASPSAASTGSRTSTSKIGAMKMFSPDLENKGKCLPGEQCDGKGNIRAVAGSDPLGNRSPYTVNGGKISLDATAVQLQRDQALSLSFWGRGPDPDGCLPLRRPHPVPVFLGSRAIPDRCLPLRRPHPVPG